MPATRLVFHVGAHKTGTSLVQKFMRDNVALLHKHRVQFIGRSDCNDLVGWGEPLLTHPGALDERIRQVWRNPWYRRLVISHENTIGRPFVAASGPQLYPDAPALMTALARVLRPYDGKVVLSVRPQDQFLESYYLQTIHVGKHHTFARWLDGIDLDAISWWPLVDALGSAFGPDRVEILDFRLIKEGQDAFLGHFFSLVDPALQLPLSYSTTHNPSISAKGLAMALAANPALRNGPERKRMRVFLQTHFSNLDYPRPQLLSDDQRAWLKDRYDDEYEALVRR